MILWLTIVGMGLITYVIRFSLFVPLKGMKVTGIIRRALNYVPPAVLSAIVFPELLQPGGSLDVSINNARLLSGLMAIVVAWRSKNVLVTIFVGMMMLWLLQALG